MYVESAEGWQVPNLLGKHTKGHNHLQMSIVSAELG